MGYSGPLLEHVHEDQRPASSAYAGPFCRTVRYGPTAHPAGHESRQLKKPTTESAVRILRSSSCTVTATSPSLHPPSVPVRFGIPTPDFCTAGRCGERYRCPAAASNPVGATGILFLFHPRRRGQNPKRRLADTPMSGIRLATCVCIAGRCLHLCEAAGRHADRKLYSRSRAEGSRTQPARYT